MTLIGCVPQRVDTMASRTEIVVRDTSPLDGTEVAALGEPELIAGINAAHQACEEHRVATLRYALEAGQLLTVAKGKRKHGDWMKWVCKVCPTVSIRQVQTYMSVYRALVLLPKARRAAFLELSIREAQRRLLPAPEAKRPRHEDGARHAIPPRDNPPTADQVAVQYAQRIRCSLEAELDHVQGVLNQCQNPSARRDIAHNLRLMRKRCDALVTQIRGGKR